MEHQQLERQIPYDINAERAFLGSILIDRDAIIAVASWFLPEYCYLQKHSHIYEAMQECYHHKPSIPPDIPTVADVLRRHSRLELVGGIAYLGELSAEVPTAVHVEYYARIVERTALLRRLIQAGGKIAALGYNEQDELEVTLDKAEAELFAISQNRTTQDFVRIDTVVSELFTLYQQRKDTLERDGEVVGITTGFMDLDKLTGGLQRSDLVVLAARPSVGKTSFSLSIVYNAAMASTSSTIAVFSLEMSREQLVQRMIAMHTGIDVQKLRTGTIRDRDLEDMIQAMGVLSAASIYIEDTAGLSIMEMRSKARRLQAQVGIDLVVVDYLQLMQSRRSDNRVQEVSEISRGLKALARELNVPVLAISQLSRAVEGRTSHVPMLSDLRESGCLCGDTPIYLPYTNTSVPIATLVGTSGFDVLAYNSANNTLETRPVVRVFATGYKPVWCITTTSGKHIRATANHRFLSGNGWQRLDSLAPHMPIAVPQHVAAGNGMMWDTIATIADAGVDWVYDITVAELHNFVAADIIVHNSIEQDADLVMFIYREELYDKETDKQGIAEIHIAKHRNGPLGVVPLRFDPGTTRFTNLERHRSVEGY